MRRFHTPMDLVESRSAQVLGLHIASLASGLSLAERVNDFETADVSI
jgi:hypothetical protein